MALICSSQATHAAYGSVAMQAYNCQWVLNQDFAWHTLVPVGVNNHIVWSRMQSLESWMLALGIRVQCLGAVKPGEWDA